MGTRSTQITSQLINDEYAGRVLSYVWNTVSLQYEVQNQASGGGGGGGAVTIADGADVAEGAKADAAWDGIAASATLIAIQKYSGAKLEAVRALLAGSIAITAAALPLPAGAATAAKQDTGNTSLASIDGKLPATVAADATLTGGNQKAIARGGAKGATAAADVTSTASGANHQALDVAIYDGAGNLKDPTAVRALTNADVVTAEVSKWIGSAAPTVGQKTMANSLPVTLASDQTSIATVGAPEATFHALCRLAARPYALSKAAIAANSRTQFATLYHTNTSTKRLRLRRVLVMFESETVAGIINFDLVKLTAAVTPATGNPAITPAPAKVTGTAEATCLALPTTGGTEGAVISDLEFNVAITGAAGTANPPVPDQWYELFSEDEQNPMGEQEALEVPAGTAGGWAVVVDNTGATNTVKCKVKFVFTEK